ncbi:MAG: hypothetical protein KAJ19_25140 [Gammaproteobacteria bacterium]|nr:hypothetical protein [Gammaproteobacteria bacterium]
MNKEEVELFIKCYAQTQSMYDEITALSKKKPNEAVNKFKLRFINQILENANQLLKENYKPFADFEKFEEDEIPTTSDITMMFAQYLESMENLHSDNIRWDQNNWCWIIDGKLSGIKTKSPSKKI